MPYDSLDDIPIYLRDLLNCEMFSDSDPTFISAVSSGSISFSEHTTLSMMVDTALSRLEAVKAALNASPLNLASLPETEA